MSKTVRLQTIQFSMNTQFKYKYSLIVKTFLFVLFNLLIGHISGATTPG